MIAAFDEMNFNTGYYSKRWLAIKLLEKDTDILKRVQGMDGGERVIAVAKERAGHVESMLGEDFDLLTADRRYGYINGVVRQSLQRPLVDRRTMTDRIDNIVTHKWLYPVSELPMIEHRRMDVNWESVWLNSARNCFPENGHLLC